MLPVIPDVTFLADLRPAAFILASVCVLSLAARVVRRKSDKQQQAYPLPPGPKPLPIVGNVLGIDPSQPWVSYTKWGNEYGDLVYSRLLNQEIIVINSEKVAQDLLEKRSSNYSDRPAILRTTNDFFGWKFNSVVFPYGDKWRFHRRLFHEAFRPNAALVYRPMQLSKARDLVRNLIADANNHGSYVQTHSASIIMNVAFGYDPAPRHDPLVEVVERAVGYAVKLIRPEVAAFIGAFPWIVDAPSWFPMKRTAISSQKLADEMRDAPFRQVEASMASGTAAQSMVVDALYRYKDAESLDYIKENVKEASVTAFAAASETTASTVLNLLYALVLHPDVQHKVQAEIDAIVGSDRLPEFSDRPYLPYLEAVLRESSRWHLTVPLSIPHSTTEADIYNGYFIPQGATVITNSYAMSRNSAKYPNPDSFVPERFILPDGTLNDDTVDFAFGFGRRICVGRYVADASVWSVLATLLATCTIVPQKDERGIEVWAEPEWVSGITSFPKGLKLDFIPRSPEMTHDKLTMLLSNL
ncbi:cytochrome P450 [Coniophora puteana RWD-64-598 SS2]|uniref:Cytochrome P450 n=1 Tax=Coniophora puteana (strain RWD-64-598) TaxID=741705 RepID=A0A5M3MXB0_CONPW|nr:cytochrome P450 [Coniophora puteana RWD-64-598 SS2]EIW83720.1 cytochrome P450 [Coniophora puteana RWD-64-598 SS2]